MAATTWTLVSTPNLNVADQIGGLIKSKLGEDETVHGVIPSTAYAVGDTFNFSIPSGTNVINAEFTAGGQALATFGPETDLSTSPHVVVGSTPITVGYSVTYRKRGGGSSIPSVTFTAS